MAARRLYPGVFAALVLCCAATSLHAAAPFVNSQRQDPASQIDAAFQRALGTAATRVHLSDDAGFLRRVSLDLTGRLPTLEEMQRWAADRSGDKRDKLVERLLAGDTYAVNWGRYWRDVVTYHTPASNNYLRWQLFDRWWVEQFRRNRPWNEVVTTLLTADGINDEVAPVNYLTALYGNPVEIAATTSRVFLGVQIQCAECHNAKNEPHWKREQFHSFAAFFGRARLVQHKDVAGRGTPYAIEGRDDGQYRMTDKKDPRHLIAIQPRFLTGELVPLEANDRQRREALARFMTSPKNPWFARAYVNRVWSSLMGWGFYPSVIELAGHKPRFAEVLDLLEKGFIASGYDMRWLFRTITHTHAYQAQLQPPPARSGPAVPAVCPSRLRPEQIFEALVAALAFDENDRTIPAPAPSSAPAATRYVGLRHMVWHAFKVNPSRPQSEVQGTIPQALLMMNSALVHGYTSARGKTLLGRLLLEGQSDDQIVADLYQRALARRPTAAEQVICRRYITRVGDRHEALEDVFWALINSTEFLNRR
jgi:hypothetical protein